MGAAAPQAADTTGVWLASDVPYAPWVFELQQSGESLNGSVWQSGAVTTAARVEAGKVNGNEISFRVTGGAGATGGTISFTGKRDGDTIVFTRTPALTGTSGDGIFGAAAVRRVTVTRMPPGSAVPSRPAEARIPVAYKGASIDVTSIQSRPDREAIIDSIRAQIDLVDLAVMDPQLRDFFFAVPLVTAENLAGSDNATYTNRTRQVTFASASFSRDKPILLHELMHAYHDQKLPGGFANAQMRTFLDQARASRRFPADAYMLSNAAEYFAMMASVYMHGTAARDPFTRAAIREKQPEMYDWLVQEFGQR
jgi:hypothetical protein